MTMSRKELREAFKEHPTILEALNKAWLSDGDWGEAVCPICSTNFKKSVPHHVYCSLRCRKLSGRKKEKIEKGILNPQEIKVLREIYKQKVLSELKTSICEFCECEFEQHKRLKARFCGDFCRSAHRKYR